MPEISPGHAAFVQTATALVQAIVSIGLLSWYVLAARLKRSRRTRERVEEFESLVKLCRDLGLGAKSRTLRCRQASSVEIADQAPPDQHLHARVSGWKTDMEVIYVYLNEAPHYGDRNPSFSIAPTRLWLEVDARAVDATKFACPGEFDHFLDEKYTCIGWEVDAIADLLAVHLAAGAAGLKQPAVLIRRHRKVYSATQFAGS